MASRPFVRPSFVAPFVLLVGLFAAGCSGDVQSNPGPSEANPLDAEESALIAALNKLRAGAGITAPVQVCVALNVSAAAHADDMRDNAYLTDTGQDGSTPRSRGCAAGYKPACDDKTTAIAEVVASGVVTGAETLPQWEKDATTNGLLLNPGLTVIGVGRALQGDKPVWAMDLASKDDANCH
jgi:uncharacterized protein YkwD